MNNVIRITTQLGYFVDNVFLDFIQEYLENYYEEQIITDASSFIIHDTCDVLTKLYRDISKIDIVHMTFRMDEEIIDDKRFIDFKFTTPIIKNKNLFKNNLRLIGNILNMITLYDREELHKMYMNSLLAKEMLCTPFILMKHNLNVEFYYNFNQNLNLKIRLKEVIKND